MTRMSKQMERRAKSPRKRRVLLVEKTGSKKDNLPLGYKEHLNAITTSSANSFISRIK